METLRILREKKSLTQQQVAEMMGVSRAAYGKWEIGEREPDHKTLIKLADLFEVTTDYLLGRPYAMISYAPQKESDATDGVRVAMEHAFNRPIKRSEAEAILEAFERLAGTK